MQALWLVAQSRKKWDNNAMDIDYTELLETIFDAIQGEESLPYELVVAVFPKEATIEPGKPFDAAIKTTASPGMTGQVFIGYLQDNPPEEPEQQIWTPNQDLVH